MTAPGVDRRAVLIGGAALATGVTALAITPRQRDGDRFRTRLGTQIPDRLGPWVRRPDGEIILPEAGKDENSDPFYDTTLSRTYAAPGHPDVMLVIAHGGAQSTSWNVHRPETCYDAAGFTLAAAQLVDWPVAPRLRVPGRLLAMARGGRIEQVGYWRRIADAFPQTGGEERAATLRRRLRGFVPDGALIRMSTLSGDAGAARAAFDGFAPALIRASAPEARRLMLGGFSRADAGAAGAR